jgi:hypothetical protein
MMHLMNQRLSPSTTRNSRFGARRGAAWLL